MPSGVVAPAGLPLAASLIGRDAALADLMAKLRAGTTSGVFALEGLGGVGKSALAAEAVARLAEDLESFPGGAAWIAREGLEGETGLADLWARVARALHLEQVAAQTDPQARRALLAAALAQGKRLLLALDNVEPGLAAEAALETLTVRNHTALLLTARHRVAPHRVAAIDLAPLPPDDSRTLFVERLAQAGGVQPTPAEEPAVAALLAAVGGLPLALELTAAYAGVQRLSLAAVARELEQDGLHALAFGDPKRDKRALLSHFERSWAALTTRQQRLFAGLALLAGASFPREAAQALAAAAEDADAPASDDDPRADLLTLVSYALVEALPGGERLRLHPLLREYAADKLGAVPQESQAQLGDAMVTFWLEYAEAHPGYEGMDALEAEAAGRMGALTWAHEQAQYEELLDLAYSLQTAWNVRGRRDEELQFYGWAERAAQELGDVKEQRWASHQLSGTLRQTGQLAEARAGIERALELARQLGDPAAELLEVHSLAVLDADTGRLEEARVGYERALELARQLGNPAAEQMSVHGLAVQDWKLGRLEEARVGYERALTLARQLGDLSQERVEVHCLAVLDRETGRLEEAQVGYERALALARQLGDPAAEADELRNLGILIAQRNELELGRQMIVEALAISEQLSNIYNIGKAHQFLAWLDEHEGNRSAAIAHFREALRCFEQVQSPDAEEVRADLHVLEIEELFPPDVVRAVRAFLNTASWPETHVMLEQEQALLLTDEADQFLGALVEQAQQRDDPEAQKLADYRTEHLQLLRKVHESDIPTAWAWFEENVIAKQG